ncbi:7353_t:CDS:2 [Funneliformis geosporum]|uniref:9254_t:CDS:1 n=1 Tax=Funneliformis geosporum TaxID=1117311 RepID=A0A9W4SLH0_9GLOM|nr:7353_t:CDS:2 [Funneliformis geosporum]CAI2172648.1 9254_t:CDS:2 [Funneliformis geosporum]
MTLFDEESDFLISYYMDLFYKLSDRFVIISELMPQYQPKQISNRWRDYLDPKLCKKSLTNEEKIFIIEQTPNYRKLDWICWKGLSSCLENKSGRRHSYNKIKNYWNANQRRQQKNLKKRTVHFLLNEENREKQHIKKKKVTYKNGGIPIASLLN